jgi:hypothetical protein
MVIDPYVASTAPRKMPTPKGFVDGFRKEFAKELRQYNDALAEQVRLKSCRTGAMKRFREIEGERPRKLRSDNSNTDQTATQSERNKIEDTLASLDEQLEENGENLNQSASVLAESLCDITIKAVERRTGLSPLKSPNSTFSSQASASKQILIDQSQLQAEIAKILSKAKALSSENEALQRENSELMQRLSSLEAIVGQHGTEMNEMRKLRTKDFEMYTSKFESTVIKESTNQLKSELDDMKNVLSEYGNALSLINVADINFTNQAVMAELPVLKRTQTGQQEDIKRLRGSLKDNEQATALNNDYINRLKLAQDMIIMKYGEMVDRLRGDVSDVTARTTVLEEAKSKLVASIDTTNCQLGALEERQNTKLTDMQERRESSMERINEVHAKLSSTLSTAITRVEAVENSGNVFADMVKDLNTQVGTFLSHVPAKLGDLEDKHPHLARGLHQMNSTLASDQCQSDGNDAIELGEELRVTKQKVIYIENKLKDASEQMKNIHEFKYQCDDRHAGLSMQLSVLDSQYNNLTSRAVFDQIAGYLAESYSQASDTTVLSRVNSLTATMKDFEASLRRLETSNRVDYDENGSSKEHGKGWRKERTNTSSGYKTAELGSGPSKKRRITPAL